MVIERDAEPAVDVPQFLLHQLSARNVPVSSIALSKELHLDHQKLIGAVKSLQCHVDLIDTVETSEKSWALTGEGQTIAAQGSHEAHIFHAVGIDGIAQAELMKLPNAKIGLSKALENRWVGIEKRDGQAWVVRKVQTIEDRVHRDLLAVQKGETISEDNLNLLKKRKLIVEVLTKGFIISKGVAFTTSVSKPEVDLTAEMIASGSWSTKQFKDYNFDALGIAPLGGHLHPLMKVRSQFRDIFFQLGFTEMPTNRYVESSFWNFDALFQPQQHPARDAHDTFFIADPASTMVDQLPADYLQRVKHVHSHGGYGSQGYDYDWKIEEAQKNIMRTHTTAVSARQLYKLAQEGFTPSKMFSIDRVFRNETLDATHLAEFHQVEGVIAERNLSLAHVIGLFTAFFEKCGIGRLRFKPTYNPYTEPSMEIFAYHAGFGKWVEIGNSGMFRPEMLLPMGLPPDVNVAGFGLSLERPTMIRYGIGNIRELFGARVNLEMVYANGICRLEKV